MFTIKVLCFLFTTGTCLCQEKIKVDLDDSTKKSEPKTTRGGGMFAYQPSNSIWRVDLIPTPLRTGSTRLEFHIVNVSSVSQTVPTSQDGVKIVAECPEHTILEGVYTLGGKADKNYFHRLGMFYGCETFPTTLVRLKPNEWGTYVITVPTDRLPKEIQVQIDFVHKKFRHIAEGQSSEGLEPDTFEASPWVRVPEPPVEQK